MSIIQRQTRATGKRGASALTYALLVGLISVIALSAIQTIGGETTNLFTGVAKDIAGDGLLSGGSGSGSGGSDMAGCAANSAGGGVEHAALDHGQSGPGVITGNPGSPPANAATWQQNTTVTCNNGSASAGSLSTEILSCEAGFTLSGNACNQVTIVDLGGGVKGWADGSFAIACKGYLDATDNSTATGNAPGRQGVTGSNAGDDGLYRIDPGTGSFDVQCNMSQAGGGWTLAATLADDANSHWAWNNRAILYTTDSTTGSLSTWQSNDFQSLSWTRVPGDEVLFQASSSAAKWIRYTSILSNQALVSKYNNANQQVGEFFAAESSGSWTQLAGTSFGLYLQREDCDAHGWSQEAAKGFVFRSANGDNCGYDDLFGSAGRKNISDTENSYESGFDRTTQFYGANFAGGAMYVYVR